MSLHVCDICDISFKSKKGLTNHLKTQKHLRLVNDNINRRFYCGCGKWYLHRQSLNNHHKSCQSGGSLIPIEDQVAEIKQTMAEQNEKHKRESDELRAQIALLLEQNIAANHTNQHIETQNIENQQNIHIHINAFGKENIDYIDESTIVACIGRIYKSVPAIIEKIHFDPDHPENHNIKITNKKLPYASVMGDNQKWKTVDKKDAIESMVYSGYNFLDEKYPNTKLLVSERKQNHFEGFQEKFKEEDKELRKQLKTDVELLVLNSS